MVLWFQTVHDYKFTFETATLAFFNKYPNPYASHVESVDTLDRRVLDGKLHTTRLIRKQGKLPRWVKPFLGKISHSWIVEKTVLDPETREMQAYQRNLDHTRIIRVEEYTTYKYEDNSECTRVAYRAKFSSGFKGFGIRDRIEMWSHKRFQENIKNTKLGMAYVMQQCQEGQRNGRVTQQ
jgi:hypothetical protein